MSEMPISKREARRALVIPTLPILIFVMALLLLSILVSLVLSLVVSFRLGDMMARPNPFNNYELVWPGRTLDDVAEYAARSPKGHINCYATTPTANEYPGVLLLVFQSTDQFYGPIQPITCMDELEKGAFQTINVIIKDRQVQELNLFSDYLQQDVLSLYWGVPDSITKSPSRQSLYLHWDRDTYTATAMLTKPYLVVSLVTIELKP